jgi:hypothetical protein
MSREEAMANHPAGSALVEEVEEEETTYLLDTRDRCDGCGAQAYYRVFLEGGSLDFCYHHYNKFSPRLTEVMLDVIDESDKLHKPRKVVDHA